MILVLVFHLVILHLKQHSQWGGGDHCPTKQKKILYRVKWLHFFLLYMRSIIIFSGDVLIGILRQEMGSQNYYWKSQELRVICQITFRHVIKLELVLHHQLLTPQRVVILHFINRPKHNLDRGPNRQDSVSLIGEFYFQRGKDFNKLRCRITSVSLEKQS